jgi:hypothetical protein
MELDWDDTNMSFDTLVMPTGYSLTENSSGGLSLELSAVAQVSVWRKTDITYITDAYSTDFETELKTEAANIEMLQEKSQQNDTLSSWLRRRSRLKQLSMLRQAWKLYMENIRLNGCQCKAHVPCRGRNRVHNRGKKRGRQGVEQKAFSSIKVSAELGELFASPTATGAR